MTLALILPSPRRDNQRLSTAGLLLRCTLGLAFILAGGGCGGAPEQKAPAAGAKRPVATAAAKAGEDSAGHGAAPKSVFRTNLPSGRDPFFPQAAQNSARNGEPAPAPRLPTISYLKLMGIWLGTARPMALINRTAFGLGEVGDVAIVISNRLHRAESQKVTVRCVEIRPDSVLISIAGEQGIKELRMAQAK